MVSPETVASNAVKPCSCMWFDARITFMSTGMVQSSETTADEAGGTSMVLSMTKMHASLDTWTEPGTARCRVTLTLAVIGLDVTLR